MHETTAAACVTVNIWPPTVMVPVRTPPVFAATVNVTAPLPLPLVLPVTVIHATLLVAVQAQPLATVTDSDMPVPPLAGTD